MISTPERRLFAGFAIATLLLAVVFGMAYRNLGILDAAQQDIAQTLKARTDIERALRTLVDIETATRGYAMVELLQARIENSESREMLGVVRTASEALLTVIDDILDYSKIESGRMKIVKTVASIADIVESVTALFALRAREKGLALNADIDDKLLTPMRGAPAERVWGCRSAAV